MEKFLPTVGFEPGTFPLRSERSTTEPRGLISVAWMIIHLVLLFLEIYPQHIVDIYSKIICHVFLSYNICIAFLFDQ